MQILWIKSELLHPVDKGGRIRTYQMLKSLSRHHDVTYLTLDDGKAAPDAGERASEYCNEVVTVPFNPASKGSIMFFADLARNLFSPLPYILARYQSSKLSEKISLLAKNSDLIVCDFLTPSINLTDQIASEAVIFQHNVEAMIWERYASVAKNRLRRAYMRLQWRRMHRLESRECARFARVIAVSEQDADVFRNRYGIPSVAAVPTGVDVEYFQPGPESGVDLKNMVFVGSMDWMPNDDGIRWFAESVLPLVQKQIPDATLTVVGRSPSAAMRRLAERIPGIDVTGTVPDVRPYLQHAAISVVPLRVGGGTRLKIYEAMATGTPMVSTSIGAEGLPVTHGEHLLIADSPESQAEAILSLLADRERALAMAQRARRFVTENCSWDAVAEEFLSACGKMEVAA